MSPLAAVPGSLLRRSRKKKGQAAAAGLVEPDSHMLIHYKKNMDRPQLTTRITLH